MRNFRGVPLRFAIISALSLLVGCPSVLILCPNDEGSGGSIEHPVDAGPDIQVDPDPCSVSNLADGLVAHYPFDGDTNDATGHGLNGIPEGNTSFNDGKIGKAIFMQGTDTRVTVPDNPALDTFYEFSLTAWVNPTLYPVDFGSNPVIISKVYSVDIIGNYLLNVGIVPGELLDAFSVEYVDTTDGGSKVVEDGIWVNDDPAAPKFIPLGEWTQVTATFDHGTLQLFLNGVLVAEKVSKVPHTELTHYDHGDLMIGNTFGMVHNYTWQGGIDDVRIYGRALSADEAKCLASGK